MWLSVAQSDNQDNRYTALSNIFRTNVPEALQIIAYYTGFAPEQIESMSDYQLAYYADQAHKAFTKDRQEMNLEQLTENLRTYDGDMASIFINGSPPLVRGEGVPQYVADSTNLPSPMLSPAISYPGTTIGAM